MGVGVWGGSRPRRATLVLTAPSGDMGVKREGQISHLHILWDVTISATLTFSFKWNFKRVIAPEQSIADEGGRRNPKTTRAPSILACKPIIYI